MTISGYWQLTLLSAVCGALLLTGLNGKDSPQWAGKGKFRILVRVEARDIGSRKYDEMPTQIQISPALLRSKTGLERKIDVESLQVAQYDPATGQPIKYGKWHYAAADWEVPYRWYDDSIPEPFPEVLGNIDTRTGELNIHPQVKWGYFYETLGEWDGGKLAWTHTQRGNKASYYAIYFNLLPEGSQPAAVPRAGYVGDGAERIEETASSSHGLLMGRVEVADWNGDGLVDLLLGCERGGMIWYPNRGSKSQPRFPYPKLMFDVAGKPLDLGFNSAPLVIDWDGDGKQDLVSGVYPDRVAWYRNVGSNSLPKLEYKGLVLADNAPLKLPHTPVPEGEGIYPTDYFPTLEKADWDGDGDFDLLAGGYVTGMIFVFENTGKGKDNQPLLKFRGPINADGRPIDTGWCAAPAVADVNGDGLPDIVSGSMAMTPEGGDSSSSHNFLYLFKNVGTKTQPRMVQQEFPVKGKFPVSSLAAPRLVDLNDDGLLDLVVARTIDFSIYYNVGTKNSPLWEYSPPLPGHWRTAPLFGWATQLMDWNEDKQFDIVHGFNVRLNLKKGNPQFFSESQSFIGNAKIFHKSPSGDQWTFTYVVDVDGDGKRDILYGTHEGEIYLHRDLSSNGEVKFDAQGIRLTTENGDPIKVGPPPGQKLDFDVLQGARTTLATADFDRDSKVDLIVGDTYGVLRYYRNLSGGSKPVFDKPVVIATLGMQLVPSVADWNEDGWPDVLVSSSRPFITLNSGRRDGPRFLPAQLINPHGQSTDPGVVFERIPGSPEWRIVESKGGPGLYLPYESVLNAVDWNGDGDVDLLAHASYGYLCWYEKSFLTHGFAPSRFITIETQ